MSININIQEVAITVSLHVSRYTNQKENKQVTDRVILAEALGQEAGKWRDYLILPAYLKALTASESKMRKLNDALTLPLERGKRILLNQTQAGYDQQMNELITIDRVLVNDFLAHLSEYVAEARIRLNGLFNPALYHAWKRDDGTLDIDQEKWRREFKASFEYGIVPVATQLNGVLTAAARRQLEEQGQAMVRAAMDDAWKRVLDPLSKLASTLASPEAVFKDTLIENVKEVVSLVPAVNLTQDQQLVELAQAVSSTLNNVQPETLRESKVMRKETAEKAAAILKRFGSFNTRKFAAAA